MYTSITRSSSLAAFFLLALGCGTAEPTPVTGALTSGRVSSDGGAMSDVPVRAYAVEADGSMTAASEPATTSATGRYSLFVTLEDTSTRLVVRVEDGTGRMASLARAAIPTSGSATIVLAPIDTRSTFTTEVELAMEAAESVSIAESATTSLFLSSSLAGQLAVRADRAATVMATATAIADARETFLLGLEADVGAGATGDADVALAAIAVEEGRLAGRLDTALTAPAVRAAYAAYYDGALNAAFDAGYSRQVVAAAALSSSSALEANLSDRVSAGQAEISTFTTFAVTAAVDASLMAASLGSSTVASTMLRTSMVAMAETGATAEVVAAAWASYETAIRAQVDAGLTTGSTAILMGLTDNIDASAATLQSAWAELGATATAAARVEAYATYRDSVTSAAHVMLLTSAGLDDGQARATLDAMAAISAAAH